MLIDTTGYYLARDLLPWAVGILGACILLWVLMPLVLHWHQRGVETKEGKHDADR